MILAVIASSRLGRGRLGRAWRFVREDEDAAEAMGIHTHKVKLATYITGAIFGGLAGVLFAVHQTAISPPSFNFLWSALILMAVVLGGMGSTPGVVVGALVIVAARIAPWCRELALLHLRCAPHHRHDLPPAGHLALHPDGAGGEEVPLRTAQGWRLGQRRST